MRVGGALLLLGLPLSLGCATAPRATVLYVTDAHEIAPVVDRHGDRGGVARLKPVLDRLGARAPGALLVFGGDLAGGTLFGGVFRGEPMVDDLGRVGVGLATFGQHDFDFGAAQAERLVKRSRFPWITANLVDGEGRPFAALPTRRVVRVGGLAVGFVGLTDDLGTTTPEAAVRQTDLVAAAAREAAALRREGAEAIVLLTQASFEVNRRLLVEVPEVDAVLTEEESETVSIVRWVGGRPIAGPCGNLGSVVELTLERRGARVSSSVAMHPVDGSVVPDPEFSRMEKELMERLERKLAAPAGALSAPLDGTGSHERETPLGSLVADAFREGTGADAALVPGSSLRAPLPAGPLSMRHVAAVLPFGNRVATVELAGAVLRAVLERSLSAVGRRTGGLLQLSGVTVEADLDAPAGRRLLAVRVAGTPLREDATYRVAVSSFLAAGGDGHVELAAGRRLEGAEPLDADLLAEHLRKLSRGGPAEPPTLGRMAFVPRER
ncbi:MAG: bifunctional metallophosphatase/5'-nucleotidase [Thermoanaerobaculia bacterium]